MTPRGLNQQRIDLNRATSALNLHQCERLNQQANHHLIMSTVSPGDHLHGSSTSSLLNPALLNPSMVSDHNPNSFYQNPGPTVTPTKQEVSYQLRRKIQNKSANSFKASGSSRNTNYTQVKATTDLTASASLLTGMPPKLMESIFFKSRDEGTMTNEAPAPFNDKSFDKVKTNQRNQTPTSLAHNVQ